MKIKIVTIPDMISPTDWKPLTNIGEVAYVEKDKVSEKQLLEEIKDVDYLLLNYDVIKSLSENFYKQIQKQNLPLKAISADITGMSWAQPSLASKYGIKLLNTPNYSSLSVAEFAITSLQLMIKKMHLSIHDRMQGKESKEYKNSVFQGQTLGIVGLGNIGIKMAELAQGIGMKTIAWNRSKKQIKNIKLVNSLQELFSNSDHISIHLKTSPETESLITKKLLMSLRGGVVVNQADTKLVNLDDIADAIGAGKITGYSGNFINAKNHRLANMPEFIDFPAQAWFTDHSLQGLRRIWVENILLAESNKFPNLVTN